MRPRLPCTSRSKRENLVARCVCKHVCFAFERERGRDGEEPSKQAKKERKKERKKEDRKKEIKKEGKKGTKKERMTERNTERKKEIKTPDGKQVVDLLAELRASTLEAVHCPWRASGKPVSLRPSQVQQLSLRLKATGETS